MKRKKKKTAAQRAIEWANVHAYGAGVLAREQLKAAWLVGYRAGKRDRN